MFLISIIYIFLMRFALFQAAMLAMVTEAANLESQDNDNEVFDQETIGVS